MDGACHSWKMIGQIARRIENLRLVIVPYITSILYVPVCHGFDKFVWNEFEQDAIDRLHPDPDGWSTGMYGILLPGPPFLSS